MKPYLILASAMCLSGCMATATPQMPNIETPAATKAIISFTEARKIILARKAELWKDPYSIRQARISEPVACRNPAIKPGGMLVDEPASCVCVALNAKNSYGGYTGIKRTLIAFPEAGGVDAHDGGFKGYAQYCLIFQPFPELNGR